MRNWPSGAFPEHHTEERRSVDERLREALEPINYIRARKDPFDKMDVDITTENWAEVLTRLHWALYLWRTDWRGHRVEEEIERARQSGEPYSEIWFDVPDFYGAESDGRPTEQATLRLLEMLSWTLTVFTLPNLGGYAPHQVGSPLEQHFDRLTRRAQAPATAPPTENTVPVLIAWHTRTVDGDPFWVPEIAVGAGGIDTQSWRLVLNYVQDHPNVPDLLGKCPECLKLFTKGRKDAQYCGGACSQKARYRKWKAQGGLKRRKKRRAGVEES